MPDDMWIHIMTYLTMPEYFKMLSVSTNINKLVKTPRKKTNITYLYQKKEYINKLKREIKESAEFVSKFEPMHKFIMVCIPLNRENIRKLKVHMRYNNIENLQIGLDEHILFARRYAKTKRLLLRKTALLNKHTKIHEYILKFLCTHVGLKQQDYDKLVEKYML